MSRPIRDGDEWEKGNLETGTIPEDQGCRGPPPEQQDVKAVSVRHCAATTAPYSCCPHCYAEQSHNDNIRSSAVGKQKKSNSQAELHLPALDLFWANFFLRVQLTSLLLISPGLCRYVVVDRFYVALFSALSLADSRSPRVIQRVTSPFVARFCEVTLCGWRDVKLQDLTLSLIHISEPTRRA